jgi:putative sterol carrier protein
MEEFVPRAMAGGPFASVPAGVHVQLGVALRGEGGGEWLIEVQAGSLSVREAPRDTAALTIVQTVDDWRGALWEGRGGAFGAEATALFRGAVADAPSAPAVPGASLPNAAALQQIAALDGLIEIVVTGGAGGDWATGLRLGPGPIPDEPTARILVTAEDAEAMRTGALEPMAAFMGGRVQVVGDITLIMQMQVIAMSAASRPAGGD